MDLCTSREHDLPFLPSIRMKNHRKLPLTDPSQDTLKAAVVISVTMRHYQGLCRIQLQPENFQVVQHSLAAESGIVEERSCLVSSSKSEQNRVAMLGDELLSHRPIIA